MISKETPSILRALLIAIFVLINPSVGHSDEGEKTFMGADMTLYFNGGAEDQVISAQAVVLVYLPKPEQGIEDFDPAHKDIARLAQRLSDNVAVVPLTKVWPVFDPKSKRWARLMRCQFPSTFQPTQHSSLLFFSFAVGSGRECVAFQSDSGQATQIVSQLIEIEEKNCNTTAAFKKHMFRWIQGAGRQQDDGLGLIDISQMDEVLRKFSKGSCAGE